MLRNDAILMMLHCLDDFLECVRVCSVVGFKKAEKWPSIYRKTVDEGFVKMSWVFTSLSPPPALLPVREKADCMWAGRNY